MSYHICHHPAFSPVDDGAASRRPARRRDFGHYTMTPEFRILRDRVRDREMQNIQAELNAIREGRHEDLEKYRLQLLAERDKRLADADHMFAMMEKDIDEAYEQEMEIAEKKYAAALVAAKKQLKSMLDGKSTVIDEEAQNLKLHHELLEAGIGSDRTLRQRVGERTLPQKRRKRLGQNPSMMLRLSTQQLTLHDWEVAEDIKVLTSQGRTRKTASNARLGTSPRRGGGGGGGRGDGNDSDSN